MTGRLYLGACPPPAARHLQAGSSTKCMDATTGATGRSMKRDTGTDSCKSYSRPQHTGRTNAGYRGAAETAKALP